MRRRFLLVFNYTAGRSQTDRVHAVVAELTNRGCDVQTLSEEDFSLLTKPDVLHDYDAVIGAGGDGTIRRLMATEAGTVIPIGFIPNGTGNVLAYEIGLKFEPTRIADVLIAGPEQTIQTGQFESGVFFLMVGFGFDGDVTARLHPGLKKRAGKFAYLPAALPEFFKRPKTFRISVDGKTHTATWAIIANARHYAGAFMLAPQAALTKHSFEVVLFHSKSRLTRLRQMIAIALGRTQTAPATTVVTGRQIELEEAPSDLRAQADGDPLSMCPQRITVGEPVRLIVPNRYLR